MKDSLELSESQLLLGSNWQSDPLRLGVNINFVGYT